MTGITKIYHYEVRVLKGGILSDESRFDRTELNVIGENEHALVVNDRFFTTIRFDKKDTHYTVLNRPCISVHAADRFWGSGITYTLYSGSKVRAATIKRQIEKAISAKLGPFLSGIDLSVVSDRKGGDHG